MRALALSGIGMLLTLSALAQEPAQDAGAGAAAQPAKAPPKAVSVELGEPVIPETEPAAATPSADGPDPTPAELPRAVSQDLSEAAPTQDTAADPGPVKEEATQAAPEQPAPVAAPQPPPSSQPLPAEGAPDPQEPVADLATGQLAAPDPQEPAAELATPDTAAPDPQAPNPQVPDPNAAEPPAVPPPPPELVILGTEVPRGTTTRLSWSPSHTLEGIATPTPVLIVNGARPGPVLCLTAAIHGDELNGIEIVRRVLYNLKPKDLAGTVIGVPIVNLQGFHRGSRYLADRRDLNRYFPGNASGSSASRIAYSFFGEVIQHCDALVDLHTGSLQRTNMPQLRGDLRNPRVRELTEGFGATVVLQSRGATGTLRRAAVDAGIPAVTLEAGESLRLQEKAVDHGVDGITTLMTRMGMIERFSWWGTPEPVYYRSVWVRADQGGILFSDVDLADSVRKGELLGRVTDPITNISSEIVAPHNGRVIGMALNQVVLPGFAAFHIAIATPREEVESQQVEPEVPGEAADSEQAESLDAAAQQAAALPDATQTAEDPDAADAAEGDELDPSSPDFDEFDEQSD